MLLFFVHFPLLYFLQFHWIIRAPVDQEKSSISLVTTQLQVGADRLLEVLLLVHHRVTVLVKVTIMGLYLFYSIDHSNAFCHEYRMSINISKEPIIICFAHHGTWSSYIYLLYYIFIPL